MVCPLDSPRFVVNPLLWKSFLLVPLLLLAAMSAQAGGLGIPSSRAGVGFGNLKEFAGLRFNVADRDVKHVTGVNVTLWASMVGFGHVTNSEPGQRSKNRNGSYTGIGLNLIGASAERLTGVHVGLLGLGAQDRATGILAGGLGIGGHNITGIAIGGLGVGGHDITGIAIGGLGVGGHDITGIAIGGLGVGGHNLRGMATSGSVRTRSVRGMAAAAVYQRTDDLYGVATGLYNRADHAEGLMIGLFNKAHNLRGVQIGLLNHVASGPAAARWLPLINARF